MKVKVPIEFIRKDQLFSYVTDTDIVEYWAINDSYFFEGQWRLQAREAGELKNYREFVERTPEELYDPNPNLYIEMDEAVPCKGCQAPIVWIRTANNAKMPIEAITFHGEGLYDSKIHINHWGKCPKAEQFKRKK